jgi:hypothetical protein
MGEGAPEKDRRESGGASANTREYLGSRDIANSPFGVAITARPGWAQVVTRKAEDLGD